MSDRGLIPEQRTDKNGNVVTRWVRGLFPTKTKARDIPKPTLASRYIAASDLLDAKDRLKERHPVPRHPDGSRDWSRPVISSVSVSDAIKRNDPKEIRLLDEYSDRYDPSAIIGTLGHLRDIAGGETSVEIDDYLLTVYKEFHSAYPPYEEDDFKDEKFEGVRKMSRYVLSHPEELEHVKAVVSRGIYDYDEAIAMVQSLKSNEIPNVINDGFL